MHIEIKKPSEKDIYKFFKSLTDSELYNFTLYEDARTKSGALKLSKTILKDKNQKIFAAFIKDEMIGFGILKLLPKKSQKKICQFGIVISSLFQGKGHGKELSKKMITWAKRNGFKKIWLTVYSDNIKAIKLYKKLGFQVEGIFMHNEYFNNKSRHCLSMALFFGKNPYKERKKLWENLSKTLALR